jgi:copper chaperone CopZ
LLRVLRVFAVKIFFRVISHCGMMGISNALSLRLTGNAAPASSMETIHLSIQDMHCGGCVARVTAALKDVAGVKVEEVAVGSARVSIDPKKTSAAALVGVVEGIGFKAAVEPGNA